MLITEHVTLFFRKEDEFSQWHPRGFVYKNISFSCPEQFMMFCKANLFKDWDTASKILKSNDPKTQKALGRKVRGFNTALWDSKCREYVRIANREKFRQNPDLLHLLIASKGLIAEASPYDKIWGIGLGITDSRALDPTQWQGENRLGEILTQLRAEWSINN